MLLLLQWCFCIVSQSHPFPAESRWKTFSQKLPEAQQNPASFSSASPNQNPRPAISKTDSKYMLLLAVIETRPEIITTILFLSGNFS